jgi:hypothetical protein
MAKLTLEEKRLEKIRMQLFGKERPSSEKKTATFIKKTSEIVDAPPVKNYISSTHSIDSRFMQRDLMKVAVLSFVAIGGQFLLYYLSLQGIINLNMFHLF